MDAISFREADASDAGAIGLLHVTSWRETYNGLLPGQILDELSAEARSAMWSTVLNGPAKAGETAVFVAENGSGIVGFGACGGQRDRKLKEEGFDGEIGAIYVLRAYQRAGIGNALMRLMARSLLARGRRAASLWVLRDNVRAQLFYERLGGAPIGEREEDLSGATLVEVAYGWSELMTLAR